MLDYIWNSTVAQIVYTIVLFLLGYGVSTLKGVHRYHQLEKEALVSLLAIEIRMEVRSAEEHHFIIEGEKQDTLKMFHAYQGLRDDNKDNEIQDMIEGPFDKIQTIHDIGDLSKLLERK